MLGAIRAWDIMFHPIVTVRCFGWKTFWRALMATHNQTFLSLLTDDAIFGSADSEEAAIVKQCVSLELRAKQLYLNLARTTTASPSLSQFFTTLAQQEQDHADLLQLCEAASDGRGWHLRDLPVWRNNLLRLNQEMSDAEMLAPSVGDMNDMMRLVVQIESSEVNHVFLGVIGASNSPFVKRLRPFRCAVELHLSYIAMRISELAPDLWPYLRATGLFNGHFAR
jgi:hypothetical protein